MKQALPGRRRKKAACRKWVCKCRPVRCQKRSFSNRETKRRYRRGRKKTAAQPPVSAPRPPVITIRPAVQRYFFIPATDLALTEERFVLANQFVNDEGEVADGFPDYRESGYYNLFVNGVLQEGQLYQVNPQAIRLAPTAQVIRAGSPIILESVGFAVHVA